MKTFTQQLIFLKTTLTDVYGNSWSLSYTVFSSDRFFCLELHCQNLAVRREYVCSVLSNFDNATLSRKNRSLEKNQNPRIPESVALKKNNCYVRVPKQSVIRNCFLIITPCTSTLRQSGRPFQLLSSYGQELDAFRSAKNRLKSTKSYDFGVS